MSLIADCVAVFRKNRDDYAMIEKEVEALCVRGQHRASHMGVM